MISHRDFLRSYHGFYIKITPMKNIQREKEDGSSVSCEGFQITVFADISEKIPLDTFTAAEGFEILKNTESDAQQFAMDVIESEEKKYLRMLDEYAENCS